MSQSKTLKTLLQKKKTEEQPISAKAVGYNFDWQSQQSTSDILILTHTDKSLGWTGSLLCFANANELVLKEAQKKNTQEWIKKNQNTALFVGVCATDPFLKANGLLEELTSLGVTGVLNYPSVGLFDGVFKKNLDETGIRYEDEIEFLSNAQQAQLLTAALVFSQEDVESMGKKDADIIIGHPGLNPASEKEGNEKLVSIANKLHQTNQNKIHLQAIPPHQNSSPEKKLECLPDYHGICVMEN